MGIRIRLKKCKEEKKNREREKKMMKGLRL